MLIGRETQIGAINRTLSSARSGYASGLLLCGDPGMGKTALLDHACQLAEEQSIKVVRFTAVEVESGQPAAGLQVLLPMLGAVPSEELAGLLTALVAASEAGPLLLAVDDAHWLDSSSLRALTFAARRLLADPVALLITARGGSDAADDLAWLPRAEIGALSPMASRRLLQSRVPQMPNSTADEVAELFGHTPLPLVEVTHLLPPEVLRGQAPIPSPVPVSEAVQTRYLRGFRDLPAAQRLALTLLAADDGSDPLVLALAARDLGLRVEVWDQCERAGLAYGGRVPRLVHPLARACIHAAADPQHRRSVHSSLADVLHRRGREELSLRHRAEAATGPDTALSREIADHALTLSLTLLGRSRAAGLFLLAADLAEEPDERHERLIQAAECSVGERAGRLAEEVAASSTSPEVLARCAIVRFEQDPRLETAEALRVIRSIDAAQLTETTAERLAISRNWATVLAGRVDQIEHRGADQRAPEQSWPVVFAHGAALTTAGQHTEAVPLLRAALASSREVDPSSLTPERLIEWAIIPGWLGDVEDEHRQRFARLDALMRATGSPECVTEAAFLCAHRARFDGDWLRAASLLRESLDLALATRSPAGIHAARLAALLAHLGDELSAEQLLDQAASGSGPELPPWHQPWLLEARGSLEMARCRYPDAVRVLQPLLRVPSFGRGVRDAVAMGLVDLVEASTATGDSATATAATEHLAAGVSGQVDPLAEAVVNRCRALSQPADADDLFREALGALARTTEVFLTARTHLVFGEHLRRTRRHRLARDELASALTMFNALRARPWAERARGELAAAGQREVTEWPSVDTADLSAQELRVAMAVTDGLTNTEVAQALFLSVKTVEFHLGNVYRKLGLRSRGGLAKALARIPVRDRPGPG